LVGIHQLTYIVEAIKNNSYSEASKILHVSRQAIAQAVQNTENELGYALFNRDGQYIKATENGILFARKAELVIRDYERLAYFDPKDFISTSSTKITIAVASSPFRGCVVNKGETYSKKKPADNIEIELVDLPSTMCTKGVEASIVDAAITPGIPKNPGYTISKIGNASICALMSISKALAIQTTTGYTTLKQLSNENVAYPFDIDSILEKLNTYYSSNKLKYPIYRHVPQETNAIYEFIDAGGILLAGPNSELLSNNCKIKLLHFAEDESKIPIFYTYKENHPHVNKLGALDDYVKLIMQSA
jgi:DNA-binding transcriptional LysR family regulator